MNNWKLTLGLFLSACIILGGSSWASAFQERGREATLVSFKGEVKIKREGKEGLEKSAPNLPLFSGDLVITRRQSSAQIALADGSTVMVYANSQFYLNPKIEEEGPTSSLMLLWGYLVAKVAPHKTDGSLRIETPLAVAAVSGTSFAVGVALDGTTRVGVEEGEVEIEEADGKISLKENQEISLEQSEERPGGETPSPPRPQEYSQRRPEEWEAWQKKIEERFLQNPVAVSQKMAQRLEQALAKERELLKQIDQQSNQLNKLIEEARKARRRRDLETLRQKRQEIKTVLGSLRQTVFLMRRLNNKLTAFFELGQELGRKTLEDRERLADKFGPTAANLKRIKDAAQKVRLIQQEARRIIKERLPRFYQQRKKLMEEK